MNGRIKELEDGTFDVAFDFDRRAARDVMRIPGARKNKTGTYTVPASSYPFLAAFATRHGIPAGVIVERVEEREIPPLPELSINIPLKRELYPYQKRGVAYCIEKKRVLVGDSMGIGKTAQAIAAIEGLNAFPCLVICPSTLKINWQREWHAWTKREAAILNDVNAGTWHLFATGKSLFGETVKTDVFIVNYESLQKFFVNSITSPRDRKPRLADIIFDERIKIFNSVILDESHRVKDHGTLQSKYCKGICTGKEVILALTGTPVVNKARDLAAQLSIIGQIGNFGGYARFTREHGYNDNLPGLRYRLASTCFYARSKKDVLPDLPGKTRVTIPCEITTRGEYNDALGDLARYLREYKQATGGQIRRALRGEIMVRIGILKNISARGKIVAVTGFISDLVERGEKVVVFAHLAEVIASILGRYPGALHVTGSDDHASRQRAIDTFQGDPGAMIIVCSIKAAGVGITLTAASNVIFIELPWHAADNDQCEDRCNRVGATRETTIYDFVGANTIDEHILEIIQYKRSVAESATGVVNSAREQEMLIENLLEKMLPG